MQLSPSPICRLSQLVGPLIPSKYSRYFFFLQPSPSPFFRLFLWVFYYFQNIPDASNYLLYLAVTIANFQIAFFDVYYPQNISDATNDIPSLAVTIANLLIASFSYFITTKIFQILQITFLIQAWPSPIFGLSLVLTIPTHLHFQLSSSFSRRLRQICFISNLCFSGVRL